MLRSPFKSLIKRSMMSSATQSVALDAKYAPPINRAMKTLDRDFFKKKLNVVVAHFPEPKYIGIFTKKFPKDILWIRRRSHIVKTADGSKAILLNDKLDKVEDADKVLSKELLEFIKQNNIELKPYELVLDYDFWKAEEILEAILPTDLENNVPSGFTLTGHIAHLNLKDEYKPYGLLIGQVILDKNPSIRTVVDKVDSIQTVYRTFKMKVLAGDEDFIVEQRESNCSFTFDFSKVYWNSRLHTEHEKLVETFNAGELVCDVMAGVGPFSIPAGKKKVLVLSNDLNPESYKYMIVNIKNNKVGNFVKPMNIDGRVLIRDCLHYLELFAKENNGTVEYSPTKKRKLKEQPKNQLFEIPKFFHHFIMNLPDSALEFLNEYNGIYAGHEEELKKLPNFRLPLVHVYCFEKFSPDEPEPSMDDLYHRVHLRMNKIMDYELDFNELCFSLVRKVAPTKPMFRVSFRLPEGVAFRK